MCKWWAAVFISSLILWNRASPQPVTENIENDRQIRQANNECCPCPTGTAKAGDMQSPGTVEGAVDQQRSAGDCPCMARAADPETSASALVPNTARPLSSFVRTAEPKIESKPLLHPEVDLASSVLNTLREATDEEYEAAKQRDAAKSNTESEEPDITIAREASGEPTKNIVNIFIKTKESNRDALSEASNIQEAKCAPDDNNSNISVAKEATIEPPSILERLIGAPKFDLGSTSKKKVTNEDSSVDSSNVKTSILDINGNSDIFKLKTSPILTNIFSNSFIKTDDSLSGRNTNSKQSETLQKITEGLRSPLISALKLVPNQNQMRKTDLNLSSSIMNENIEKINKQNDLFKSKPVTSIINELSLPNENSMPLKSVLQLKDIELFPPTKLVPSMPTAKSGLPPLPKISDLFKGFNKKEGEKNNLKFFGNTLIGKANNNVQIIPKNRPHTEILDTVPSPSDNNEMISDNICRNEDTLKDTSSTHSPPLLNNIKSNFDKTLLSRETYSDEEDEETMPDISKENVIGEKKFDEEEILPESSSDINENTEGKNSREGEFEKKSEIKTLSPKFQSDFSQKSEIARAKSKNGDEKSSLWKQFEQTNLDGAVHNEKSMPRSNINEKMEKYVEMEDLLKSTDAMPSASFKTEKEEIIRNKASCDDSSLFDQMEDEEGTTFEDSIESIDTVDKESTIDETDTDTCANNLNKKATVERNTNEMDVGASEPRMSRLSIPNLRSTADDLIDTLNNAILEPSSIINPDPLNLFKSPSIINLPSMNDIGTKLSNILRLNEDRMDSSEIGFGNSNANPIISRSRSGSAKTVLPTLKTLDDINLNSFHIKPVALKSSEPKMQTPAINMNSYRARLSLPKSLDMKPVQLESTLGKKAGTLEKSFKGSPSKSITASNLKSKSSGRSNSKNPKLKFSDRKLIDTPRRNSVKIPLDSTLSLISTTDSIRSRAEDAVRSVKASLDSALNENTKNILSESLNSQNLLQAVASTHDDVQTKLQALHSDFSDRLSSLHSNIFDQTRIPSLRLHQSSVLGKSRSSLPNQSIKLTQSSLRKEPESFLTQKVSSRRESQKNDGRSESIKDKLKLRTTKVTKPIKLELPTAANMMVARLSSPDKPKSKLALRLENNLAVQKTPKNRDLNAAPVSESKLSTQIASDPGHVFDSNLKNSQPKLLAVDKGRRSRIGSKLELSRDTFDSPSEVRQIRILSPIRISSKSAITEDEFCQSDTPTPPRPPMLRQEVGAKTGLQAQTLGIKPPLVADDTKEYGPKSAIESYESISENSAPSESTLKQRKPLLMRSKERSDSLLAITAPKQTLNTNKSSLLTKMRDASRNRNNDMSLQPADNSPSNIKMPLDDNLKENVNYKCKMVCTKDLL